jgi:hypothetical protein
MKTTRRIALLASSSLLAVAAPVAASAAATPFSIYWTAPGDDGSIGRATAYDLRYSTAPITAANFLQATRLDGVPAPSAAGTAESFVVSGLADGVLYYLAMKTGDDGGNWSTLSNLLSRPAQTAGVGPSARALAFSTPWPNPARASTRWAYSLPTAMDVQVDVFDVSGRHLHTLASGRRAAGTGEWSWNLEDDRGAAVGSGVYFVRARLGDAQWTRRLIVQR